MTTDGPSQWAWTPPEPTYAVKTTIEGKEVELKNVSIEVDYTEVLNEMETLRVSLAIDELRLESNCASCGRPGYSARCIEGCENQNWIPKDPFASHTSLQEGYDRLLALREDGANDNLQAAGEYVDTVESIRSAMSVSNPNNLVGGVHPDRWRAMAHGVFEGDRINIQSMITGVIIVACIREEIQMGDLGQLMYVDNIPYFCKIVDEEQSVGRSTMGGIYNDAVGYSWNGYLNTNQPPRNEPKPTEQELLQQKVDNLLKKITEKENLITVRESRIESQHIAIKEDEQKLIAWRGELELLTHQTGDDCPHITVQSLPKKRKWWQFWKPKVMPGVELVL